MYEFKKSTGYISAADGSEVEPYVEDTYRNDLGGGAKSNMAAAEAAADEDGFTDEELAELDTFKNLISAATAEKTIRALPATGMTADMKLVNSDVYRRKTWEYREDKGIDKEKIFMMLYFTNEDRSRGLNASVDEQTIRTMMKRSLRIRTRRRKSRSLSRLQHPKGSVSVRPSIRKKLTPTITGYTRRSVAR